MARAPVAARPLGWACSRSCSIVALGAGATCVALATADRTSGAYDAFLRRSNAGDVAINPFSGTQEIEAVIRTLPGVEEVTNVPVFVTTLDDGTPRPRIDVELNDATASTAAIGSPDGRYLDMDRPIVREGRLPTAWNEAVVNVEAAEAEGISVGDRVPVSFWGPGTEVLDFVQDPAERERLANEVVAPVGTEEVEIVGVVQLADEVLPDDLYTNQRLLVSPALASEYLCQPARSAVRLDARGDQGRAVPRRLRVVVPLLLGEAARRCGGRAAHARRVPARSHPPQPGTGGPAAGGHQPRRCPSTRSSRSETDRTRRTCAHRVAPVGDRAARVLGAAAAVVTIALAAFAIARELRRNFEVQRRWYQLGLASGASVGAGHAGDRRGGGRHRARRSWSASWCSSVPSACSTWCRPTTACSCGRSWPCSAWPSPSARSPPGSPRGRCGARSWRNAPASRATSWPAAHPRR